MSTDPGSAPHQGPPLEPRPPAIANLATWWLVAAGVVAGIGGLVARRRWLDVVTLVVLGLAVGIAGGVLDLRARV